VEFRCLVFVRKVTDWLHGPGMDSEISSFPVSAEANFGVHINGECCGHDQSVICTFDGSEVP